MIEGTKRSVFFLERIEQVSIVEIQYLLGVGFIAVNSSEDILDDASGRLVEVVLLSLVDHRVDNNENEQRDSEQKAEAAHEFVSDDDKARSLVIKEFNHSVWGKSLIGDLFSKSLYKF